MTRVWELVRPVGRGLGGPSTDPAVTPADLYDHARQRRALGSVRVMVVGQCRAELGPLLGFDAADEVAAGLCGAVLAALRRPANRGRPVLRIVYEETVRGIAGVRSDISSTAGTSTNLDCVGQRERALLALRLVVGLTVEQVAVAMGSTAAQIRFDQHRALSALRRRRSDVGAAASPPVRGGQGWDGLRPSR